MLTIVPPPLPVDAGDVVHVPKAVPLPSGRSLPPAHYTVLRVEGRRILVRYRPDCRRLGSGFQPSQTPTGWLVPPSAEMALAWLDPGDWTAYAAGADGPVSIPDR